MNQEQMERLAKYATDKYFDTLSDDAKLLMTSDKEGFMRDYIKTFEVALQEVRKSQNTNFEEFGTENSKLFI